MQAELTKSSSVETDPLLSKTRVRSNLSRQERNVRILSYLLLAAGLWIMILPFIWMLSTSFKTLEEVGQLTIQWIPAKFHFENYKKVFEVVPMARFMWNTLFVSATVTAFTLLISSLAAYAFARMEFKTKHVLFYLYLTAMMIPEQITMIPNFILMKFIGWLDTYNALIFPKLFSAFGVFMLRQFFMTIPKELEEAAKMDGCSRFRIYWSIILPLAKPALVTLGIFTFLQEWNSFIWPLITINNPDLQTIQVGLRSFQTAEAGTDWPLLMAGSVLAEFPIILLYLFAQRYIIEGISSSGIKG